MKTLLIIALVLCTYMLQAQPKVYAIEPVPNEEVAYSGDLSEGIVLDDLSWAWSSSNACFPETQKSKFTGKHLFFTGIIPKFSEMEVTVIPKDPTANFSVYAYEIGVNSNDLVPNLPRCIRCEADHKQERNFSGKAPQDHTRKVTNLVAINNPYRVVIGVTGADGLSEGEFTLVVTMKSR
ncbi:hypothetical protein [Altibacter sp.]|uniref:hypothetical protein n=1 Tax=Altibacter sp. TaxID=2024823 RepID=UPI00258EC443|nr:hypothetical protein [Altibacter sp.]MCW8981780.1 hypothetical protein [Altibacter sp.]MCW9038848.1 hypothetical protein [Altibacter sp.]